MTLGSGQGLRPCGLVVALLLAACGGSSGGGGAPVNAIVPDACSTAEQNRFVDDVMRDIYYWLDELPAVAPEDFDSPEALLEALVFADLDRFSVIVDEAEEQAFFSNSQFIGVGVGLKIMDAEQRIRVTQVFADGPAAAAGLARGYDLLEINGMSAAQIIDSGQGVSPAFGADEIGTQVDLVYRDLAATEMSATIFKALVTIEPVTATAVLEAGGRTTGYIAFRNFVEPSFEALENAFAEFDAEGVEELVLDLRYNGGGLISVAEFLSGLLGGTVTDGQVFANRIHNRLNTFRNVETRFLDEANALNLSRLVVITTGGTASASELIINGLKPFMDVKLVGADTLGKPVGSYGFTFCEKILRPISFANENADGSGDFFDGFPVDCIADDDLTHALGDPLEASLAEALRVIETGDCTLSQAVAKQRPPAAQKQRLDSRAAWHDILNAY